MIRLGVLTIVAIAVLLAGAVWWLNTNSLTADQLCQAFVRMVETSSPTPGTADDRYFKAHPKQLARARKRFLEQLPCTPEPLRP